MPAITIIIPLYNGEKFIIETLNSVKNQTFNDFECIIVNDGSTDNSKELVSNYIINNERFKLLTIKNSGSADFPIKYAVNISESESIMVIGHDDTIDPECLSLLYKRKLETQSDVVILNMIFCEKELDGVVWSLPSNQIDVSKVIDAEEALFYTIGGWQIPCNGMLVNKELYNNIEVFPFMNGDEITSRIILSKANKIAFSTAKYIYRNHQNSISRGFSSKLFERIMADIELEKFINNRFGDNNRLSVKMQVTRFYNLVYLYADFINNKTKFSKDIQNEISMNFCYAYKLFNKKILLKKLKLMLSFLFLTNYCMFKISSYLYVKYKDKNGRKFIIK